ncbi:N-acetyltransferase family protein [Pseudarthrobacter sp. P1]|uniref:GNAT family N-acetyltransferase n=1 Tax=Pseudarthrobacter sp. P1 TaxID=3418418 RepID=UPI003CF1CF88
MKPYAGPFVVSGYRQPDAAGRCVGLTVLRGRAERARDRGYWTIQSSIFFPENLPSVALYEKAGYRRIGHREHIARMAYGPYAGVWPDTILVEQHL